MKPSPAGGFWDAHPQANEPNAKATLKFKPCIQWVQRESTLPQHATTEICSTVFRDRQLMRRFRYIFFCQGFAKEVRASTICKRTQLQECRGCTAHWFLERLPNETLITISRNGFIHFNITTMMMLTISVLVLRSKFHCTSPTTGAINPLEMSYIIYSSRLIYHKYHIFGTAIVLSISHKIVINIIKS